MGELTIIDLVSMLLANGVDKHTQNVELLKSLYERDHASLTNMIHLLSVLIAAILGALVVAIFQGDLPNIGYAALVIAFVISAIILGFYSYRSTQLSRNYLDLLRIYHLLSRYF